MNYELIGKRVNNYIRISLCGSIKKFEEAIRRMMSYKL